MSVDSCYQIKLVCPWCNKGKTMADHTADVNISCQCGVCRKYYVANLSTRRVQKARASPAVTNLSSKKLNTYE